MISPSPERRERILAAAERLLRHYGFRKTTVGDIARQAGLGVGTVYLEFSSKDEIVAELTQRRHDLVLQAMRQAIERPGSFADRLGGLLETRVRRLLRLAGEGQHGVDLVRCICPAASAVQQRFREEEQRLLAHFLAAGAKEQQFNVRDPLLTARVLLRICDSFGPGPARDHDPRRLRLELKAVCRLTLEGLLRR